MNTVGIVVIVLAIVANAGAAIGDLTKADFILKTSDEVGVDRSWLPVLAALKAAGAVGLLVGLLVFPIIGTLAAAGLVVFFVGALITHIRSRAFHNIYFPGFYLTLATASLVFTASR